METLCGRRTNFCNPANDRWALLTASIISCLVYSSLPSNQHSIANGPKKSERNTLFVNCFVQLSSFIFVDKVLNLKCLYKGVDYFRLYFDHDIFSYGARFKNNIFKTVFHRPPLIDRS